MNLTDERLKQLNDPSLTAEGRVLLRRDVAVDYILGGQYGSVREALFCTQVRLSDQRYDDAINDLNEQ